MYWLRIHRKPVLLYHYDFVIKYIYGKNNGDAFTRDDLTIKELEISEEINTMKDNEEKFSLKQLRKSGKLRINKQLKKCIKSNDILIKKLEGNEVYWISGKLA